MADQEQDKEDVKKKVDESWKEAVEKEKARVNSAQTEADMPEPSFSLFISGLMMEALIALGEIEHPVTKNKEMSSRHARFIIETLSMLKNKTNGNLSKAEEDALEAILYELRMKFVGKINP